MSRINRRDFLAIAGAVPFVRAAQAAKPLPNFVILFADDMGYGDLACYGHPTIRTPNLDRMAGEGIRFTSFYAAAPVCTPSRVGLLTGRYALRAGLPNNTGPDTNGGLPLTEILLPQLLKKKGYKTMAIGKWHLGYKPKEYLPVSRGFDSWVGLPYSNDMIPPFVKTSQPLHLYRDGKPVEELGEQSRLTELYTEEATKFIKSAGKAPFLLYLPYAMPHLPISASSRFSGRSRAGLYGDVIEAIDWSAGEILRTLKEQGLESNTLVVFASDNGPWNNLPDRMLQKGNERWHTGTKNLLRESKGTTYEGGQRVPGIVRWPGVIPPGQVSADMVSTLDLLPTIAKLAGVPLPADRVYDGYDILPFMQGKAKCPRNTFYYFQGRALQGIREGSWKFRLAKPGVPELFNLDVDPAEQYNVYERNKEIGDRLHGQLRAFAGELSADRVT